MRSVLSRVFRYGVATVRCEKDVAADLRGAIVVPKVKHFAAITRPSEVGTLLRAIDGYPGHKVTVMAMRLSPHVLLRPGELRQAEWSDIDFNEAIWFVPAERMKMRRPHRVLLSRQVIAMLATIAPQLRIAMGRSTACAACAKRDRSSGSNHPGFDSHAANAGWLILPRPG